MAEFATWVLPVFIAAAVVAGLVRRIDLFETFLEGAREGLQLVYNIFPYVLAIYVAIGVFRASGALDAAAQAMSGWLALVGIPAPVVPLALMRPLSGSAALGYLVSLLDEYGPDSLIGRLASVMQGSSETTFYVLSVYLGAVGIKRSGPALAFCLLGDAVGFIAAVWVSHAFWG
ncbi:MAG: spore maturation protein [Firmicutes bacterium]|nr:spore maturation protein [Bacillota bacterium]